MRGRVALSLSLFLAALPSGRLAAGVYLPAEPPVKPHPTEVRIFHNDLDKLRGLTAERKAEDGPNVEQERMWKRVEELRRVIQSGTGTLEDQVNLSGYLLRLQFDPTTKERASNAEEAIRLLEAVPEELRDFQAWANLATAYQLSNRDADNSLEHARDCLRQALKVWPSFHVRYLAQELIWFRLAEKYHLELIESRHREAVRNRNTPPQDRQEPGLDPLFPVPLGISGGGYQAGLMKPEDVISLPSDALLIVEQLVLWLPLDDRLYWQWAEVVNAQQGDFSLAYLILGKLTLERKFAPRALKQHRVVLQQAKEAAEALGLEWPRVLREQQLTAPPLPGLLPPGASPLLEACGWVAAIDKVVHDPGDRKQVSAPIEPPPTQPRVEAPDHMWQHLAIGFAAGAVLTLFLSFQWREIRRRRHSAAGSAASRPG